MKIVNILLLLSFLPAGGIFGQTSIVGKWIDRTSDGRPVFLFQPDGILKIGRFGDSIKSDTAFILKAVYKYTIDTSQWPVSIDMMFIGAKGSRNSLGILEMTSDTTMRIIYNRKGGSRPKNFKHLTYDFDWYRLTRIE